MKGSIQAAAAIGVGYLLGRRKKLRIATVLAAATAVGGGGSVGGMVVRQGMKMLGSNEALQKVAPQLTELADTVRGDLLTAGKAAATAAVAHQVDALAGSIHDRTERLRNPEGTVAEGAEKAGETGRKAADTGKQAAGETARRASSAAGGRMTGRGRADEADVDEPEDTDDARDEDYDDEDTGDEDYESDDDYESDEAEAEDAGEEPEADDEPETAGVEAPAPPRRASRPRRSPVARTAR